MLRPARNWRFLDMSTAALIAVAILPIAGGGDRGNGYFVPAARARSSVQENIGKVEEKIRRDIDSLNKSIQRWRGDLPEGIAKTNGRIEATEIDVASKYAGRLETVMVDEGDEVKQGQVVTHVDSPEYEAQLQTAKANVLVAQSTLASAVAKVAQAQADQIYAKGDLERGKDLVDKGWLTKQMYDQRVDRLSTDNAAVEAAESERDAGKVRGLSRGP